MEECLSGCETCRTTFTHLSHTLYQAESEIDGMGLFATITIAKDRMIIPFKGHKWKPNAATVSDGYALQLDSQTWITPIGIPRYVNHSCEPNAAFMKWTSRTQSPMVSIVALKEIAEGVEICVNYGAHHDLSTGRQACHCNAPSCVTHKGKRDY
jgi:SET domain-containing protein